MKFWYKSYVDKYTQNVYDKIFIWNHIKKFKTKFVNKLLREFDKKKFYVWMTFISFFSWKSFPTGSFQKKSKGISFSIKKVSFHKFLIKNISRKIYKSLLNLLANIFNLNLIRRYQQKFGW